MSTDKSEIDLGFAEECEPWLLTNTYFPSKIGGRPAWLNLENLPVPDELKCSKCNESLVFLCQVMLCVNCGFVKRSLKNQIF